MMTVRCSDKDRLIAYLYGEADADERAAVESHLAGCALCAAELGALGGVREQLRSWQAPEADLGFRIVREPEPARAGRGLFGWGAPAWAQAIAAVLLLAVGAAIANLDVRYDERGFAVRTGWSERAAAPDSATVLQPQPTTAAVTGDTAGREAWRAELAALETRLRADFAGRRPAATPQPQGVRDAVAGDTDVLLQRVRGLIQESERRQQRELALRLGQVVSEVEAQRRADLVRIEQNLGRVEGLTGQEVARQRELLNYLVRVSQRP